MKTQEQALKEWTLDEIEFDAGQGKTVYTSTQFTGLVALMKDPKNRERQNAEAVNWEEADIVAKFAVNSGRELTPQWLMQFESMAEARKHLMESWQFDALR